MARIQCQPSGAAKGIGVHCHSALACALGLWGLVGHTVHPSGMQLVLLGLAGLSGQVVPCSSAEIRGPAMGSRLGLLGMTDLGGMVVPHILAGIRGPAVRSVQVPPGLLSSRGLVGSFALVGIQDCVLHRTREMRVLVARAQLVRSMPSPDGLLVRLQLGRGSGLMSTGLVGPRVCGCGSSESLAAA